MRMSLRNAKASTVATWRARLLGVGVGLTATAVLAVVGHATGPADAVTSEEFTVEPPTLLALGFDWRIGGDGNRNASVAIAYRQRGTAAWKDGLPLHRLQNEHVGNSSSLARHFVTWDAPDMFAGSLFDLEPDTAYEVRLTLSDPDGVNGQKVQLAAVRTRPEPMPATDGRVFHVYPFSHTGPKQEPSFTGLKAAYFWWSSVGDMYNNYRVRVQPGDVMLVHAGVYVENRYQYANPGCCQTTWDGTYYLTGKGTAERPIAIKAAGDGEVIFDGAGNMYLFNMMGSTYNYFEGITFRNTEVAILGGWKDIAGTTGLTVKHSKFVDVGEGIHSDWQGARNFYIADNDFLGKNIGVDGGMFHSGFRNVLARAQYAIKFYGSGHVIAHNRVRHFHDGIDHASFGRPDPQYLPVSNDIYNNDIANLHDDCIEADGTSLNMRIMRNRCVNVSAGFGGHPIYGGPAYVIRNVVYEPPSGAYGAIKTIDSQGWTILNNTFLVDHRTMIEQGQVLGGYDSNSHFRNNLFLAQDPTRPAFEMATLTSYSTSDYNGFMAGAQAPSLFDFMWPPPGTAIEYDRMKLRRIQAKTLEEFRQATGREAHSILVDYRVFRNLKPGDPNTPTKLYDPDSLDFTLNPAGPAIDAGVVLPNLTDGFSGKAPDLGAYELGHPVPHYGPRPR